MAQLLTEPDTDCICAYPDYNSPSTIKTAKLVEAYSKSCPAGTFSITNTVCDLKNKLNTCKQINGDYDSCLCIKYTDDGTNFLAGDLYVIDATTTPGSLLCDNVALGNPSADKIVPVTNEESVADSVSDWCSSSSHSSCSSSDSSSSSSCSHSCPPIIVCPPPPVPVCTKPKCQKRDPPGCQVTITQNVCM